MKNIFNHTKRPYTKWEEYEAQSYDWDAETEEDTYETDVDYIEGEEDDALYYADEEYREEVLDEDEVYYAEEGADGEYYGDEFEEDAYYAEEAEDGEYYADEFEEDAYYAEETEDGEYYADEFEEEAYYAEEAEDGEYYADELDEDGYYAEDEDAYYAEEDDAAYASPKAVRGKAEKTGRKRKKQGNVFVLLKNKFLEMGTMDRVITATGVAVLILALVTGSVYASARMIDGQIEDFVSVGAQLDDIHVIGEQGLLAVADAEAARLAAAGFVEEEEERKEYEEAEYGKNVTVDLDLTSVLKDLKVKFVNQKTDKLVANVPFSVTITKPDGKSETWSDDDMDGIIYKTELKPGKYKVAMNELTDEKYKDYTLSAETKSVEVKKDIEYKKIDVKNEIKDESEINASKEDTKKNETAVESYLKDTVQWVETTGPIPSYEEVAKSTIADPMTLSAASGKAFMRMAEPRNTVAVTPNNASLKVGETVTVTATVPDGVSLSGLTWSSSDATVATVAGSGASATVTAVKAGTATITFKGSATITVSGSDTQTTEYEGSCTITVTEEAKPGTVSVEPASVSVAVGKTAAAQVKATGFASGVTLSYAVVPTDAKIATASVDNSGKITVTGVAAGSTTITVTAKGSDNTQATATLTVTVTGNKAITLDKTTATVFTEATTEIKATIANAATQNAVTAESSNTGVATVSVNGRTVTVKGVAAGSATITIKYSENNEAAISATCAVTVKAHPKNDKTTVLKDTSGNELYVLEGNNYRKAVYADYYSASKFYKQGKPKYTGWNTIDNKLYFFDASGKAVTGEQVIQGAKYNFASDGSLVVGSGTMGIDVSKWNGNIDWNAVKNSGVSYVIIRCGYRGSSQGSLVEDPKYAANIKGATAAGLKVGVYFFTQAINEVEAVQEASMVLELVKNYKISYPIFLDVESSGGRADGIDKATRTAVCKAFCKTIQAAGYTAGVYANKNWFENKIDASALSGYKIWLAQYASTPTYKGRYDLWQYKSTGRVSGISGDVDLNLSYLGY